MDNSEKNMPDTVLETVSAVPAPVQIKLKKEAQSLDKRDLTFMVLTLVFSIIAVDLVFFGQFSVGITVSELLFLALSTAYFGKTRSKISAYSLFCGTASAAAGVTFAFVVDGVLSMLTFLAMIYMTITYILSLWGSPRHSLGDFRTVFDVAKSTIVLPISKIAEPFRALRSRKDGKIKKAPEILVGIIVAVPVLCIVIPQLISSDAAFEGLMNKVFAQNIGAIALRAVLSLLVFPVLLSFFFAVRKGLDKKDGAKADDSRARFVSSMVVNTALCLLSVVYAVYLLSQLSYFFSAFSGVLPDNYSVAQYARRGFFEICRVSAVNLIVMFASLVFSKLSDGKLSRMTKLLDLFIGVFTMLLISTAISKMIFYIGAYGMTRKRLLTSCFMIVLFFVFVFVIIRIFNEKFEYMKYIIAVSLVVLIAVSFANIDGIIAGYNIDAYESGKLESIDVDALYELGPGATPEVLRLLDDDDEQVKTDAAMQLSYRMDCYIDLEPELSPIRYFNLTAYREKELLFDAKKEIERILKDADVLPGEPINEETF